MSIKPKGKSSVHPVKKFLRVYYMLDIVLGTGDGAVNKTDSHS